MDNFKGKKIQKDLISCGSISLFKIPFKFSSSIRTHRRAGDFCYLHDHLSLV